MVLQDTAELAMECICDQIIRLAHIEDSEVASERLNIFHRQLMRLAIRSGVLIRRAYIINYVLSLSDLRDDVANKQLINVIEEQVLNVCSKTEDNSYLYHYLQATKSEWSSVPKLLKFMLLDPCAGYKQEIKGCLSRQATAQKYLMLL